MSILSCPKCNNELTINPADGIMHCCVCSYSLPSTEYKHPALGNAAKSRYISKNAESNIDNTADNITDNITDTKIDNNSSESENAPDKAAYCLPHSFKTEDIWQSVPKLARPFLKSSFKNALKNNTFDKLLIPVWSNKCNAMAGTEGVGEQFGKDETSYYIYEQEGSFAYDSIITNASSKMNRDTINNLFPYNTDNKMLLKPDETDTSCKMYPQDIDADRFYSEIKSYIKSNSKTKLEDINAAFDSTHNKSFDYTDCSIASSLLYLPAWKVSYKQSSKDEDIYINAQTGKIIGRLPLCRAKFILSFLITCILIFGVTYGIYSTIEHLL